MYELENDHNIHLTLATNNLERLVLLYSFHK